MSKTIDVLKSIKGKLNEKSAKKNKVNAEMKYLEKMDIKRKACFELMEEIRGLHSFRDSNGNEVAISESLRQSLLDTLQAFGQSESKEEKIFHEETDMYIMDIYFRILDNKATICHRVYDKPIAAYSHHNCKTLDEMIDMYSNHVNTETKKK